MRRRRQSTRPATIAPRPVSAAGSDASIGSPAEPVRGRAAGDATAAGFAGAWAGAAAGPAAGGRLRGRSGAGAERRLAAAGFAAGDGDGWPPGRPGRRADPVDHAAGDPPPLLPLGSVISSSGIAWITSAVPSGRTGCRPRWTARRPSAGSRGAGAVSADRQVRHVAGVGALRVVQAVLLARRVEVAAGRT